MRNKCVEICIYEVDREFIEKKLKPNTPVLVFKGISDTDKYQIKKAKSILFEKDLFEEEFYFTFENYGEI